MIAFKYACGRITFARIKTSLFITERSRSEKSFAKNLFSKDLFRAARVATVLLFAFLRRGDVLEHAETNARPYTDISHAALHRARTFITAGVNFSQGFASTTTVRFVQMRGAVNAYV